MYLVNTLGLTAEFDSNFSDVKPGEEYYEAIGIAKQLGITTGIGNNLFNPEANITRQDIMTLTARVLNTVKKLKVQGSAKDLNIFRDKNDVSNYAIESAATLVKEGLIVGNANRLKPKTMMTRAEAAVLLYRIYNFG
jgi:hypothetical protein